MTDKEMLMIAYGAIKAASKNSSYEKSLEGVLEILERHIFPAPLPVFFTETAANTNQNQSQEK